MEDNQWFDEFNQNIILPITIVAIFILVFLFIRWISFSGYPIFGSLWIPMFIYFGRGMNAFYEQMNYAQLKSNETGRFWTLFDPIHPVDDRNEPNYTKIYASESKPIRFFVASMQVLFSWIHGMIAFYCLFPRWILSLFYLRKPQSEIDKNGMDGFYMIRQSQMNSFAEQPNLRGDSQTDVQGNKWNVFSTVLQRINWIVTLGMDRQIYANLHLIDCFKENRIQWAILWIGMFIFVSSAFSMQWYFLVCWIVLIIYSIYIGGFQLPKLPSIHGFFLGENNIWSGTDFISSLLRIQCSPNELPTARPQVKQTGGFTFQNGLSQINLAEQTFLPPTSQVSNDVIRAYKKYKNNTIPELVYVNQVMTQKYEKEKQEQEQAKQKQENAITQATGLSQMIPGAQAKGQSNLSSIAKMIPGAQANGLSQVISTELNPTGIPSEEPILTESNPTGIPSIEPISTKSVPTKPIPAGTPLNPEQSGGNNERELYRNLQKITPITWIPVPTSWMSGIPAL